VGAGDEVASPRINFLEKIDWIWANLVGFGQNLAKIKAKFKQKSK